jgi:hypothetical protein
MCHQIPCDSRFQEKSRTVSHFWPLIISLLLASLTAGEVGAQTASANESGSVTEGEDFYDHESMAPAITAARATDPIRIDGVLDEASWQSVSPTTSFTQRMPMEGISASERTEVRVLFDDEALYIGARLFDSEPEEVRAALARRDVISDFDYVMIHLDTQHDHRTAYVFVLTPSGSYQDAVLGADGRFDLEWDPVWEGAARVDDQGWAAEWKIPFSQLRFESGEDVEWGIQIVRVVRRKNEIDLFPFVPRNEDSGPTATDTSEAWARWRSRTAWSFSHTPPPDRDRIFLSPLPSMRAWQDPVQASGTGFVRFWRRSMGQRGWMSGWKVGI